ncbi:MULTISPECIES: hypothetical protein [Actinomycetes]|uniref:Uncharacterized protein n=1 Tax=Streptomyces acidiscabies TaxID=42234 RepID=A0ABU4MDA2_9ACTN|nr:MULTISPECIES: hypothetical protein [Actinomycetes]MDX2973482.1 hypothetical protein [Kribbella solani]MDX3007045.1 hypothetical protein [Kribbella solani]MDX3026096.1 hypothetical protein [Streptomyces acidiscabies]
MTTDPKYPLTESEASAEAYRLIHEAYRPQAPALKPTSFRDHSPVPPIGDTPPVHQPDKRIVPEWAAGIAVASIGIGAGVTGLGCGAWLVLQGLSSVTLFGVLAIAAPFAGIAVVATAVGAAVSRAKSASTTNVYQGTVIKRTDITSTARGIGARSRIEG